MKALSMSRWDFLATKVVLILLAVATPVVSVVLPAVAWLRDRPLTWQIDVGEAKPLNQVVPRSGVEATWPGTANVEIANADTGTWLATLVPGLGLSLAVAVVVWLILRLNARIQAGEPFAQSSVTTLRLLAVTLIVASFAMAPIAGIADSAVREAALVPGPGDPSFVVSFGANLAVLLLALVFAAVAEAFARGVQLQEDIEGLV